jgi:phage FluMu gp28-like protein
MTKTTAKAPGNPRGGRGLMVGGKRVVLDPAQLRFYDDEARVLVACWHRQKGKDFTAAAKAVRGAMLNHDNWYIVSLTQRQADETHDKAKAWAEAFRSSIQEAVYEGTGKLLDNFDEHFEYKAHELSVSGGGKVISLPGRDPDTLAGFSGNVIFTEFGLFPNGGYDHWRVVFPLTTRGYRVIAISTPRGKNTKFFELVNDPDTYSVHFCDIHRSVAEGFVLHDEKGKPCDIDTFRKLYGDEAGWAREYECQFTGDLEALVVWPKLVTAAEIGAGQPFDCLRVENGNGWRADFFTPGSAPGERFEIGWDVARHGHLSALWVNRAFPGSGKPKQLRYLVLMHRCPFELQREIVRSAMDTPAPGSSVGCGDATGLGMDSNEQLHDRYGDRWEGIDFGGRRKGELGSMLATAFDDRMQGLPAFDRYKFIATDIYAVQKEESGAGESKRLRLLETENPLLPDSHCDIAYAGALALRAGTLSSAQPRAGWI